MQKWIDAHGFDDRKALIDYAAALIDHYGQASGALACKMYDATAEAQNVMVPTAEMVELPGYGEIARNINGTIKQSEKQVSGTVGRMVKKVGADTTLKNAERDGGEFAWISSGDTCAYCLALAAKGWRHVSKNTVGNGHAEHIHANCDCEYAVRFDGHSTVAGYDPDKYLEEYENAGGDINAMRRKRYEQNKDEINARKRELYKEKKKLQMNLQFFAKIPDEKLTEYALNMEHPTGKYKAEAFQKALGYTQENYADLKAKILDSFNENELVYKREDKYGKRYEQIMQIAGPNGKTANVLTAWIKDDDNAEPRLTSIYVDKR